MFTWEGLPSTIPQDYLERTLIGNGQALCYYDENIGLDVLRAEAIGFNRHDLPTHARTYTPTTNQEINSQITRNIKRLADSEYINTTFDKNKDGVLIYNMAHGQSCWDIINHFTNRLVIAQNAFDTNLLYMNMPFIFQVPDEDTRLSIERKFAQMSQGKPFIIEDKELMSAVDKDIGFSTTIPFYGKEIMDVQNEIMMKFKQTVGIDTAGVDKAERTNTLEIESNTQHTKTVLQVMLEQRQMACEAINSFFGVNISVHVTGVDDNAVRKGDELGSDNDRTEEPFEE